jgi:hypothetical protein
MKRQGDIEGVLEAWFLDGPLEMPDRLFDAVFDQVERVPQRRLARLQLRFTDMSPTARLLVAAGATILVLGIGVAAVGALQSKPSTTPDAAPPTTAPSGAFGPPVAEELRYRFVGEFRSEPPAPTGQDRSVIAFTDAEFTYNGSQLTSTASSPTANSVLLRSGASANCPEGDEGEYTWTVSSGATKVVFTLVREDCDARAAVIPGDWVRADCPDPENECLGPLEAASYPTYFIDPWVPPGAAWRPRFGAITYDVPAGWENVADYPTEYKLAPQDAPADTGIFLFSDVLVVSQEDQCSERADPDIARTASSITDWIATAEGIAASSPPAEVTVGGLSGWRIDVSMDPTWTSTCPFSQGAPTRSLFVGSQGAGFAWGLGPDTRMRLYLLDLGDGRTLVVSIESPEQATFDAIVDEATGIVESMVFTPPE